MEPAEHSARPFGELRQRQRQLQQRSGNHRELKEPGRTGSSLLTLKLTLTTLTRNAGGH